MSINAIRLYRGDTIDLSVELTDKFNTPINVANNTAIFMVKNNLSDLDSEALINEQINIYDSIDANNGIISVLVNPINRLTNEIIEPGKYFYGLTYLSNRGYITQTIITDELYIIEPVRKG